jgi:hypothetical protein
MSHGFTKNVPIDTDEDLTLDSDYVVPSQQAVKAYVDGRLSATNATDLTDGGETALHTHDHGALNGLTDDDHTQYLLASGTRAGSTSQAQDFGSTGIKTDTIAESTAAAGVTVDGVLLKDGDVFVADDEHGINARVISYGANVTDHFRSIGVISAGGSGYSWQTDAGVFVTAGGSWNVYDDYCRWATTTTGKAFFAKSVSVPGVNRRISGRFTGGGSTEFGLRLDDGTNSQYMEFYVVGSGAIGAITATARTNAGTTTTSITTQSQRFLEIQLVFFYAIPRFAAYVFGEMSPDAGVTIINGPTLSGLSAIRAGIMVSGTSPFAHCDWFESTF